MSEFLARLKMILTLRCEQASVLMSDSMDRRLLLHERLALRGHLIACRVCPILAKQLHLIRRASGQDGSPKANLESSARNRIKDAIRSAGSPSP